MEQWKTIEWAPNYQISNFGGIRQLGRTFERKNPKHPQFSQIINIKPKVLNGYIKLQNNKPICRMVALRSNGKTVYCRVHQLVLTSFVGPCPPGLEGCHNNGNPLDNRLDNLRWDTRLNNAADMKLHGTFSPPPVHLGEAHPNSKLRVGDVRYIKSIKKWPHGLQRIIAKNLGVSSNTILRIRRGDVWSHVNSD